MRKLVLDQGTGLRITGRCPEVGINCDDEVRDTTEPCDDLRLGSGTCPLPHHAARAAHLGLADHSAALLAVCYRGPQHADGCWDEVSVIRVEHVAVRIDEGVPGPGFEFRGSHEGASTEILEQLCRWLRSHEITTCLCPAVEQTCFARCFFCTDTATLEENAMWLELTSEDGQPIFVNMDNATDFYDGMGDAPRAIIQLAIGGGRVVYVKERASVIMNMIVEEDRRLPRAGR